MKPAPAPAPAGGARAWLPGLATLAVLGLGVWFGREDRVLPAPVPASAPETAFSSERALAHLREIAREPRPLGSPEHARVRELLVARLEALGVDVEVDTSVSLRGSGEAAAAFTLRNLTARLPGTEPAGTVALVAHYDSEALAPGAGDDGVGLVVILETVRALLQGPPLENDLVILVTDGEEIGLLGARAFASDHPWMDEISVVLNLEMRGGGGPAHMFETGARNGWIVRTMQGADPRPAATSLSVDIYRRMPNDTDFTVFREAGIQGLNYAAIGRPWMYHQPTDVPENVQEATVQHMGSRVLALTRELGGRDLGSVHAPDLVFTTLPLVGIVAHDPAWVVPISIGVFVLWLAATLLATGRGRGWGGVPVGLGLGLAGSILAGGLGWGLARWLSGLHPDPGHVASAFYGEGWHLLGLAAGVLAGLTALLALARRRFAATTLGAGLLGIPVLCALLLAFAAPLTAIEFQLPALVGVVALGAAALEGRVRSGTDTAGRARLAVLVFAFVTLVLTVPLVEGMWMALSLEAAPGLGILVVVALAAIAPALSGPGAPGGYRVPALATGAAVLLVATGALAAGPSAERPLPSTLLYVLDRETDEALWATRDDPGRSWAEERAGPFDEERTLSGFLVPRPYLVAPAPVVEIPGPEVRIVDPAAVDAEGTVPGGRRIGLRVRSTAGAEVLSVVVPEDSDAELLALEGEPLPAGDDGGARGPSRLTHQGVPEGAGLVLDVRIPEAAGAFDLVLVEEHLRPREYLGDDRFERPPGLVPSPSGRSDRLLVRTRVEIDPAP